MNLAALVVATAAAAPLQGVLDEQRTTQDIAGVSAVVFGQGETLFLGASGVADLETGAVMTPDTRLYIGSVSKVLTAAVTLQLVESGQLDLDDEIPDIAQGTYAPVRIRHLLSHSSGLEREGDFGYWFDADFPTNSELADYLARAELRFAPGSDTRYSNIGYAALGLVISRSVSRSFDEALHAWLLEPLGMRSSGVTAPVAGMANGYTPPGRMLPSNERPFAGVGAPVGDRHVRMYHDAAAMAPAFGIYSTARDMGHRRRERGHIVCVDAIAHARAPLRQSWPWTDTGNIRWPARRPPRRLVRRPSRVPASRRQSGHRCRRARQWRQCLAAENRRIAIENDARPARGPSC
jgi:CubicO group peptidase (beta-lactamase class C family)